ncbi:hypothetical protein [Tunturiibacter psychrotolerans]|uniref:hypothetical protein n=1 Tax=Tunturiibacter psychrotolerans TaxID=3069686 RepID=UPI003D222710
MIKDGIVLDVDTYLRDTPREAPPRARIFERYMSTIRYIARFRDAEGQGYDEIVIVAHSLGALISGGRSAAVGPTDADRSLWLGSA